MKRMRTISLCVAALAALGAASVGYAQESGCVLQVSPSAVSVYNNRSAEVTVISSDPACPLKVESRSDWITVSPANLKGSGIVRLTIAPASDERIGAITVGEQEVTVFQKGDPSSYLHAHP